MNYGQFGLLAEEPGTLSGQTDPNNCTPITRTILLKEKKNFVLNSFKTLNKVSHSQTLTTEKAFGNGLWSTRKSRSGDKLSSVETNYVGIYEVPAFSLVQL